jgi:uncharacterized protein YecE (DUF72 family)
VAIDSSDGAFSDITSARMRKLLYVGTSGFSYPSWRGPKEGELGCMLDHAFGKPEFYPAGTPQREFLRVYAGRLPSVELNATFYQLPSEERLHGWAEQTPPDFRFAVKMNRRATHFGDLSVVGTFCERVRVLGERLGPILVQLPPSRPRDDGWLELMRASLDPELEYAFEFRNESWAGVEGIQLVNALDGPASFRYLRLREPPYDEAALHEWAERLQPLLAEGTRLYVYFKHENEPLAPQYASRLLELLETRPRAQVSLVDA